MGWWGKAIGGTFGFMLGGPLGALLGAALGHNFDKGMGSFAVGGDRWQEQERIQTAFFTATFSIMGYIAKADGKVSRAEIAFAETVIQRLGLDGAQRRLAIELFNQGKGEDFDLDAVVEQFRRECHRRNNLIQMFLELQLQAALADGVLDGAEERELRHIFTALGLDPRMFERLVEMVTAAEHFAGWDGGGQHAPPSRNDLSQAYHLLGVEAGVTDGEVKKAYRRLMNQHHPDKLVAKGLPEEMVKMATEKVQEIRSAYDQVKRSRGMKK